MLDQLFGSKTRVQILRLFFQHPKIEYYPQAVTKLTGLDAANVFRELKKLATVGILLSRKQGARSFYRVNVDSPVFEGLRQLLSLEATYTFLPAVSPLPQEKMHLLQDREWYHQRFDGSPLFILSIGEAEVRKEVRKPAGTEANIRVCFFSHGTADWYLDQADIHTGAHAIRDLAEAQPTLSDHLLKDWHADEQTFEDFFSNEFPRQDLASLTDPELNQLWSKFYEFGLKRFSSSSIIDHFALGTDEYIRALLRKEVYSQPAGEHLSASEFTQVFATATAPVHQSFINQAEIDLLKIATQQSKQSIADYQQHYFWINNNYTDAYVLPEQHFAHQLTAWKTSKKNLKVELIRLVNTPKVNSLRKRDLFKRFKFSTQLKSLIKISEDFSWWQDERKKATYLNIHMAMELVKEVAKRVGYEVDELRYATASEVQLLLKGHGPSRAELKERRKLSVVIMTREGLFIETGKQAEALRNQMFGHYAVDETQDVRGLSACLGRVIGTVKVVKSVKEMSKVQAGDILVAVMTRPDYVPAMRKAAAIVTNEGGITSHAAIVSRELGIPCIIGTKIATEVFHDGDLIEVNANHGWVRKVRQ